MLDHKKIHAAILNSDPIYVEKRRKALDKAVEAAKVWHSSPEGIEWHKKHAHHSIIGKIHKFICKQCGIAFESKGTTTLYCSKKCYRKSLLPPDLHLVCKYCGNEFTSRKKRQYCSSLCKSRSWNKKKKEL